MLTILIAYLMVPIIMVGNPAKILERPFPLIIWKAKYSSFHILNDEADNWKMTSGMRWHYPFSSLEGPVGRGRVKSVDRTFQWFNLGYIDFYGGVSCVSGECRSIRFNNKTVKWFNNSIQLIPNKYPVSEIRVRDYRWTINLEDESVSFAQLFYMDSLFFNGVQGTVRNGEFIIEGKNGGELYLVENASSVHDANWGDGKLVSQIRIPEYGSWRNLLLAHRGARRQLLSTSDLKEIYLVFFLKRNNTIFKCTTGREVGVENTIVISSSEANLGDGRISTTRETADGFPLGKYLSGYLNGNPVY